MEGFDSWWILWSMMSVLTGVLVGFFMAITMRRKGRVSLLMIPLAAWQILWMSWGGLRATALYDWITENDYSFNWYEAYFLVQSFFWWICIFLALVPAMVKDKPAISLDADTIPTYE